MQDLTTVPFDYFNEIAVSGDGENNCGYNAMEITRQEAYEKLLENIDSSDSNTLQLINNLLKPLIWAELKHENFINYLKEHTDLYKDNFKLQYESFLSADFSSDIQHNFEDYAADKDIIKAYLKCDLLEKKIQNGSAHVCILQAIAFCQKVNLNIWEKDKNNKNYIKRIQDGQFGEYIFSDTAETRHLLFVNNNHYNRLISAAPQSELENKNNILSDQPNPDISISKTDAPVVKELSIQETSVNNPAITDSAVPSENTNKNSDNSEPVTKKTAVSDSDSPEKTSEKPLEIASNSDAKSPDLSISSPANLEQKTFWSKISAELITLNKLNLIDPDKEDNTNLTDCGKLQIKNHDVYILPKEKQGYIPKDKTTNPNIQALVETMILVHAKNNVTINADTKSIADQAIEAYKNAYKNKYKNNMPDNLLTVIIKGKTIKEISAPVDLSDTDPKAVTKEKTETSEISLGKK